ncbi:TPA: AIDA repeat-containing protein, partial [Escherichia coli]
YDGGQQTVEAGGTAENTTIKAGGQQDVSGTDTSAIIDGGQQTVKAGGKATGTTINKDGRQYVETGGTAEDTIINEDGLMQNAGEDSGTTVKDGGVYELGRYSYGVPGQPCLPVLRHCRCFRPDRGSRWPGGGVCRYPDRGHGQRKEYHPDADDAKDRARGI